MQIGIEELEERGRAAKAASKKLAFLSTEIKDKLYRRGGKVFSYGLKFMPHKSTLIPQVLAGTYKWLNSI